MFLKYSLSTVKSDVEWAEKQTHTNEGMLSAPHGYVDANGKMLYEGYSKLLNAFTLKNMFYNLVMRTNIENFSLSNVDVIEKGSKPVTRSSSAKVSPWMACNVWYVKFYRSFFACITIKLCFFFKF